MMLDARYCPFESEGGSQVAGEGRRTAKSEIYIIEQRVA